VEIAKNQTRRTIVVGPTLLYPISQHLVSSMFQTMVMV
jgi:hypothetical protein